MNSSNILPTETSRNFSFMEIPFVSLHRGFGTIFENQDVKFHYIKRQGDVSVDISFRL